MSDHNYPKRRRRAGPEASNAWGSSDDEADFATQLARAEFGRHYIDTRRVEQTLKDGEILLSHKKPGRRTGSR
jgi:hypothetical protein